MNDLNLRWLDFCEPSQMLELIQTKLKCVFKAAENLENEEDIFIFIDSVSETNPEVKEIVKDYIKAHNDYELMEIETAFKTEQEMNKYIRYCDKNNLVCSEWDSIISYYADKEAKENGEKIGLSGMES